MTKTHGPVAIAVLVATGVIAASTAASPTTVERPRGATKEMSRTLTGAEARASRAAVPARLAGTWRKTVTRATWQKNGEYAEPGGRWAIAITKTGLTKAFAPAPIGFFTSMPLTASGTSAVFGPTADGVCPRKGFYTWSVSEGTLAVKVVKDTCNPRRILMTAGIWRR